MRTGNKVKRSYSISESTNQRLNELSEMWKISKTGVLERILRLSPDVYPGRVVTVFSFGGEKEVMVVGCDEDWSQPYTGYVSVKFPPSHDVHQLVFHVTNRTFEELIDGLKKTNKEIGERL